MPLQTPIKLTLYHPDCSVRAEYICTYMPFRLFKTAIRVSASLSKMDVGELTEADADALAGLVVEAFGRQFTADELWDGADLNEAMAVMAGIVARGRILMGNPTRPPLRKPERAEESATRTDG